MNVFESLKGIRESFVLLIVALVVGLIVSAVAQLFMIAAKNLFIFIFKNENFSVVIEVGSFSLNMIPLLICVPSSILIALLMYYLKLSRWFGPADTIFAAHNRAGTLDLKGGFSSTLASFISISGGASVGIYGPLVHFGGTVSSFIRRLSFVPKIPHDIIIGSGVAAAISAGFGAPLAGIIFAHETVLRHFSMKAVTALAISSMAANLTASEINLINTTLLLNHSIFEFNDVIAGVAIIGPIAAIVAIIFMRTMIFVSSIPKKINIKHWQAPVLAGICCGICGMFLDELLGLGTDTLKLIITSEQNFQYLLILLIGKLILTSICIGFGFFGGTYSPALFLGAVLGALIFQLPLGNLNSEFITIFAICGMAAVSSSVIGAPITSIILVLELTGSYEYAIVATFPIVICSFITSKIFSNSFFDKQLLSRGVAITKGREQILLSEILIEDYTDNNYTSFNENITIHNAIKKLKKNETTEGYIISNDNIYLGKINLIDLILTKHKKIRNCMVKKPLIIDPKTNILEVIKSLSNFVGESIPIVEKKSNKMIGVISENNVLNAYLEISEEINQIEKY